MLQRRFRDDASSILCSNLGVEHRIELFTPGGRKFDSAYPTYLSIYPSIYIYIYVYMSHYNKKSKSYTPLQGITCSNLFIISSLKHTHALAQAGASRARATPKHIWDHVGGRSSSVFFSAAEQGQCTYCNSSPGFVRFRVLIIKRAHIPLARSSYFQQADAQARKDLMKT